MYYRDIEHFKGVSGYTINGVWYPRVTKILEIKSKPGLDKFLREVGSFAAADDVKNKSAIEGTAVHETVGKLIRGEIFEIPPESKPSILTFQKFQKERGIIFLKDFIERQVLSLRYRYAGTVDALALVDGKFGVLDIKTSPGFYPEYNLQTAAYVSALQEFEVKRSLNLPRDIETRWILRINQHKICGKCGATLREKGGRSKIRNGRMNGLVPCKEEAHLWGEAVGDVELKEFPYYFNDVKAFIAAKTLWEWENDYWLKQAGYLK